MEPFVLILRPLESGPKTLKCCLSCKFRFDTENLNNNKIYNCRTVHAYSLQDLITSLGCEYPLYSILCSWLNN